MIGNLYLVTLHFSHSIFTEWLNSLSLNQSLDLEIVENLHFSVPQYLKTQTWTHLFFPLLPIHGLPTKIPALVHDTTIHWIAQISITPGSILMSPISIQSSSFMNLPCTYISNLFTSSLFITIVQAMFISSQLYYCHSLLNWSPTISAIHF